MDREENVGPHSPLNVISKCNKQMYPCIHFFIKLLVTVTNIDSHGRIRGWQEGALAPPIPNICQINYKSVNRSFVEYLTRHWKGFQI